MKLNQIQISENSDILSALYKLNSIREVSRLILFVHDASGRIIGSLTDGDIRRSLVQDAILHKPVGNICNKNFIFEYNQKEFLNLRTYQKMGIKILPILDKDNRIIRIIDLDKTKSVLPLECIIMAGGRGKRLGPLTDSVPKPMLPLGGKPIIEHNIDRLISFGIQKIYISINYRGEQIVEYFGDGSKKGISIEYIREKEFLGTAGAIALVEEFKSEHILLMNSDLFTNIDFECLYLELLKNNADMVVASTEYKVDIPFAIFETTEQLVTNLKEKPSYVYHSNAGIYIFNKNLVKNIPKNSFYDITDLMDNFVKEGGKLVHSPIVGFWIDIGNPTDYKQAQEFVKHINL